MTTAGAKTQRRLGSARRREQILSVVARYCGNVRIATSGRDRR